MTRESDEDRCIRDGIHDREKSHKDGDGVGDQVVHAARNIMARRVLHYDESSSSIRAQLVALVLREFIPRKAHELVKIGRVPWIHGNVYAPGEDRIAE